MITLSVNTDANKVRSVVQAYIQIARGISGKFVSADVPIEGSKHWNNLLAFHDAAVGIPVTVPTLMLAVMDYYPPYWCTKIFKRPYPPITVVVAEKSRSKGLASIPKTLTPEKPDELAKFYFVQLRKVPADTALAMAEANVFGLDGDTNRWLIEMIKGRMNA